MLEDYHAFLISKMRLFCIYWIFLLISSASSGILFLIAACDRIAGPIPNVKAEVIDNVTLKNIGEHEGSLFTTLSALSSKVQFNINDKTAAKKQYFSEYHNIEKSQKPLQENEESFTTFTENLTQQPNLSQGISDSGQAVILTLVDTASLELQNLAEPHFSSDDYTRIASNNLSQSTAFLDINGNEKIDTESTLTSSTTIVSSVSVNIPTANVNGTNSKDSQLNQDDQVVVVRAEQKFIDGNSNQQTAAEDTTKNEDTHKDHEETVKSEDGVLSVSGEQDTSTAKIKLGAGSTEEAAPIILDGIVESNAEHHEDIPSFSEWAQKRLEEAEKKKTHPNASIQNLGAPGRSVGGMKVRSKNYASPDCGAKIVAVNPEARSARSVLVSTRDEYMLNTCTSKIWFVVELCEAIQAKKIELANFELFSSSPKDFSVFVSDRFPTRDWSPVGQFTAKDERDIQSFTLHPYLFGKFIKVELHSHYGSEHFCPTSLFRTYGTSEFEVLETETEVQESSDDDDDDDDDDQIVDNDSDDSSKNLFGSARDAVIRIVKKAAEVLVQSSDSNKTNVTEIQSSIADNIQNSLENCMTPKFVVLCKNCNNKQFDKVFQLLSCKALYLNSILKISFFSKAFYQSNLCDTNEVDLMSTLGKNFLTTTTNRKKPDRKLQCVNNSSMSFVFSIFSHEYVTAFCNILVAENNKLIVNSTSLVSEKLSKVNVTPDILPSVDVSRNSVKLPLHLSDSSCKSQGSKESKSDSAVIKEDPLPTTASVIENTKTTSSLETIASSETIASQIKPTKTLSKENIKRESSIPILEPSKEITEETAQADIVTTPSPLINSATVTLKLPDEQSFIGTLVDQTRITTSQVLNVKYNEVNGNSESVLAKNDGESTTHDPGTSIKEEKDEKSKERDNGDDIKLNTQDQLNIESLLSDLENETPMPGSSSSTVSYSSAASTPLQKESVFLRLSNRIKALERNMSLSSQYLEELSRRYKKQVEEMQRSLERATVTMNDELKKSEERELKRLEDIAILHDVISSLTQSVDILLYDKNSWKSKLSTFGQHIALIFIEITIFILIISYCRRSNDPDINIGDKTIINKETARRRSAESMLPNLSKNKKRRPSEMTACIGTYGELMIGDNKEAKKEKRKNRRKDSLKKLNAEFRLDIKSIPSRQSFTENSPDPDDKSGSDYPNIWINELPFKVNNNISNNCKNNNSNDGSNGNDFTNNRITIENPHQMSHFSVDNYISERRLSVGATPDVSKNNSPRSLSIFRSARLHSPSFMKTALRARSKRDKVKNHETQSAQQLSSDNWEWYSRTSESSRSEQDSPLNFNTFLDATNTSSHNGDISNSNEHTRINDNGILSPKKKVKKEGSLKKMVKKLF